MQFPLCVKSLDESNLHLTSRIFINCATNCAFNGSGPVPLLTEANSFFNPQNGGFSFMYYRVLKSLSEGLQYQIPNLFDGRNLKKHESVH